MSLQCGYIAHSAINYILRALVYEHRANYQICTRFTKERVVEDHRVRR